MANGKLAGRVAVITGGSKGLGKAMGEALGRAGAKLALVARNATELSAAAKELTAAGVEAEKLLAGARDGVVSEIFDGRDAESLKKLAHALISHPQTIALLASRDNDTARLVFARSADAVGDMNTLMREACALLDGRGGGRPDMAQGGGKNVGKIGDALTHALTLLNRPS